MENTRMLLDRLSTNLSTVKYKVSAENSTNDLSVNLLLETTIIKVFNETYNYEAVNSNIFERNSPGIDGIDDEAGLMIQVTSTNTANKIDNTIDQIIDKKLYHKYKRLKIIYLKDKSKISSSFLKKIQDKINGKFYFNTTEDLIDFNDIYKHNYYTQDLSKISKIVTILDEFLKYIPEQKRSGITSIGISFHDEELENVYTLVDGIIREGYNVYINSQKLYDKFRNENHNFFDFIIFSPITTDVSHIKYSITVLSNTFIYQNFNEGNNFHCNILRHAFTNDAKFQVVCFDRFLNKVNDKNFRSYISLQKLTINISIKKILHNLFSESLYNSYSIKEVKEELTKSFPSFLVLDIADQEDYSLLNFKMDEQEDIEINYLILNRTYNLQNAVNYYKNKHKNKYSKSLNILIPKDFDHKTRRRLETVKSAFMVDSRVHYIDEHIFDKRYKSLVQKPILSIKDFISPVVKFDEELLRINDIIHWIINNSDSSVAIIKAAGGIGKTTICERIHDIIIEDYEKNIVIFIDASKYIEEFRRKIFSDEAEYDLYNIFKACHPHASIIDKNSFYLNYSLGNLIIIFDGIDEIISTIPSFSLQSFLDYLENLRQNLGRGKILVNCRDTYIEDFLEYYRNNEKSSSTNIQIYELLAFDENLANEYFSKHFISQTAVKTCNKLLKEIYPIETNYNNKYIYPPFVLEIIIYIVSFNFEYESINSSFQSNILQQNDSNDTIIYNVCNREVFKKEANGFQLNVDDQIRVLVNIAIEEKGKVEDNDFERLLQNIGLNDRLTEIKNGLVDHPLLIKKNSDFLFRFDFFNTYFKSLGIFTKLCSSIYIPLTDRFIKVLAYDCNINSVVSKNLIQKISKSELSFEHILDRTKSLIREIYSYKGQNPNTFYRRKQCISNILLIILKSKIQNDKSNIDIVKLLFGEGNNGIENFYLIDIPDDSDLLFDFSDLYFTSVEINNYADFFNCKFSNDTFFSEKCFISNVYNKRIKFSKISAKLINFDKNIQGDNSIFRLMKVLSGGDKDIVKYFKDYFKPFYLNKKFENGLSEFSISGLDDNFVKIKDLTQILENNNLVFKDRKNFIFVNRDFYSKLNKFFTQGILFAELNRSIKDLEKFLIIRDKE